MFTAFQRVPSTAFALLVAMGLVAMHMIAAPPAAEAQTATAGQIIISEFRLRGPSGAQDEFIEIYNASGADHVVTAADASGGYSVVASDGVIRCFIPNGQLIPNRGHFLCVNVIAYSLSSYPAGNGTTATPDASYSADIPDNAGIALFNTQNAANFDLAHRLDAVGSAAEANTLYKEGTGYQTLTPFSIDYSFYRDNCGKQGIIVIFGPCPSNGFPVDTNNNLPDFVFVDTNGTSAGAGQRLGAPGPENLSSPIQRNSDIPSFFLDALRPATTGPNRSRDLTPDPANNSTFGTIRFRRRWTNNTGLPVSRLRFRIVDITTFPAPSGIADMRARTVGDEALGVIIDPATCASTGNPVTPPCNVVVFGTVLEQPPSQPNGGAFNSTVTAPTITLAAPLAPGASINLAFMFGLQQTGSFKFYINVEALTVAP